MSVTSYREKEKLRNFVSVRQETKERLNRGFLGIERRAAW